MIQQMHDDHPAPRGGVPRPDVRAEPAPGDDADGAGEVEAAARPEPAAPGRSPTAVPVEPSAGRAAPA